jgi:hypothetical protein
LSDASGAAVLPINMINCRFGCTTSAPFRFSEELPRLASEAQLGEAELTLRVNITSVWDLKVKYLMLTFFALLTLPL